jgi:putative hemolysin
LPVSHQQVLPSQGHYRTIAGLILFILERIPKTGDHLEVGRLRYEVVDMDGNRIDKVLVTRTPSKSND